MLIARANLSYKDNKDARIGNKSMEGIRRNVVDRGECLLRTDEEHAPTQIPASWRDPRAGKEKLAKFERTQIYFFFLS